MANTAESGFSPVRQFYPYTRPRLARWPIPGRLSQCLLLPVHVWLTAKLGADVQRRALGEVFTRPETCPWVYWKHPTLGGCAGKWPILRENGCSLVRQYRPPLATGRLLALYTE